jgi:dynamin 1-like protein
MDEGTNALELLQGTIYPLKLGYYGVKCRSQQQIIDGVPIEEAIKREATYFKNHAVYSAYSANMGIPHLSKSLNSILLRHIKKSIPTLNQQISATLLDKENELRASSITVVSDDPLMSIDSS